jgi:hypothetical protein
MPLFRLSSSLFRLPSSLFRLPSSLFRPPSSLFRPPSYLFILSFFLLPFYFSGQTFTQTIRGTVLDADSKYSIPGVNIYILNLDTPITAISDANGKFRLEKVPVGRHLVKFSFIGYEEVQLNNVVVNSGKEVVLTIEMHESVIIGQQVDIIGTNDKTKANNDLVTNSSRNFQSEETERYAGSRFDPSKMVANFAGVSTGNDARNDIIVRGNSPLGVLWRLEGVNIPNPNHFSAQGSTGGPISILNNNLLGSSDFLTGAFPAEYGNKTAAVFDLKLRNGNNERYEFFSQVGINGFELGSEGPLSKKTGSSFLISYRYSTFFIFDLLGIRFGVSGIPEYNDGAFKFFLPTKNAGVFTVWGIGGKSSIELLDSEKDSTDWSFTSSGEDLIFGSGMGAGGLSHLYFFNQNFSGKLTLSGSVNQNIITLDTLDPNKNAFNTYTNKSYDYTLWASYVFTHKINAKNSLKYGAIYQHSLFDYNAYYYSRKRQSYVDELKEDGGTGLAEAYFNWQFRPNDKHTLTTGIHYQYFLFNGSQALEPRAGWRCQVKKNQAFSLAYGMHSQTQPTIYYFLKTFDDSTGIYTKTNHNLDFSRSQHLVASYDVTFKHDLRLKTELYGQYLYGIPLIQNSSNSFSLINVGNELEGLPLVDSLENKGTGKNYGIEITFEKFFSKHFYFLTTLSLFEATYKGSDNVERQSAYSGGYVYNILGGYELPVGKKKNKIIGLDLKFNIAAGNRYTPVDLAASITEKHTVYIDSLAWSRKFKDYSKFDVKISFKINSKKATHVFLVHIENIFNRKNVLREVFDEGSGAMRTEYQLGVFPYGAYRIEF